jgi:uncharacterized lipoprotein YddW (UPF0748 family)
VVRHLLLTLSLLLILARPAGAQLVVVAGADPAAARAEALLQLAGFAYHRLAPAEVTTAALAGCRTAVLLHAPLTPAGAAAVAQFAAGGGKLVLVGQDGPAELYRAVGVDATPAAPVARFERIERVVEEGLVQGMPAVVRDVVSPGVVLSPLPGTTVLARRAAGDGAPGSQPGPAAVTLAPGGAAISSLFAAGDQWQKSWLLQAVLAAVDPELAEPAARGLRRQAEEELADAAEHWARVRNRAGLSQREIEERLRVLQALRAGWADLRRGDGETGRRGDGERPMADAPSIQGFIQHVRAFDMGLTPSLPGEIRGIWIHTYAPTDWDRVAREVKAAGLNCLFVRVGRGGNVIYPSALLPRDAWAEKAGGDELKRAIDAAHRHGLQFYAWRVNFHMGSAPKAYRDRMAAEDRLVRDSHGVQADFANPGDPRNTELELQVMREMVEKYDVDGIQFDYIRYPDAPSYDFDYGPVSRREFEKRLGHPVPNWPADVLSGPLKTAYEDWERDNVSHLVERVYHEVKRLKPWVQVSAAVWRNHRRYRAVLKQDWPLWVERGWLDLVVPMDYTPEPETFAATVDAQVALTRGRVPVAAGIGSWLLQTPEALARQVEIAREAGAAGFVLFAYNAEQIEEQLAALHAGATATETRPAFVAPPMSITLTQPVLAPKDAPLALAAGSPLRVRVAARSGVQGFRYSDVQLETPRGELLQRLGQISGEIPAVFSGVTPAGRFQPVVRGMVHVSGTDRPFVARGPLMEGRASAEIAALRAEERPPVFPPGAGPRVGVYAGGLGAETLLAALSPRGMRVAPVHRLRAEHLAAVDVLVLPQFADVAELDMATQARLPQWVEGGKTLILTHDAIGARWHPRLFPELVRDVELAPASTLVTGVDLGDISAGARFRHQGSDQFRITPGPGASVLVRENPGVGDGPSAALGAPVVVAGRVGQGTVILVGFLSGYQAMETGTDEVRLLAALARYRAAPAEAKR